MSWTRFEAKHEAAPHQTSAHELQNLRGLIARDLSDAAIPALSADRRFATAYNAALQACTMAIACSGYRVTARAGHHAVTFEAVKSAIGAPVEELADYFDLCRRKRNVIDYQRISVATDTEANEILRQAMALLKVVETWISSHHPALAAIVRL